MMDEFGSAVIDGIFIFSNIGFLRPSLVLDFPLEPGELDGASCGPRIADSSSVELFWAVGRVG